jgi:putative transposase
LCDELKIAEDYRWSSARAHVFRIGDELISESGPLFSFGDWSKFLQKDELEAEVRLIRKHARTGRPLGNGRFIQRLEEITGRTLLIQRPGRKSRKYGK